MSLVSLQVQEAKDMRGESSLLITTSYRTVQTLAFRICIAKG